MSIILGDLALCHLLLQNYDEAVVFAKRAVGEQPDKRKPWGRVLNIKY
jgi:hypothetical protein